MLDLKASPSITIVKQVVLLRLPLYLVRVYLCYREVKQLVLLSIQTLSLPPTPHLYMTLGRGNSPFDEVMAGDALKTTIT